MIDTENFLNKYDCKTEDEELAIIKDWVNNKFCPLGCLAWYLFGHILPPGQDGSYRSIAMIKGDGAHSKEAKRMQGRVSTRKRKLNINATTENNMVNLIGGSIGVAAVQGQNRMQCINNMYIIDAAISAKEKSI